jgi:hypothetical protein
MCHPQDGLDYAPSYSVANRIGQALAIGYRTLSDSLLLCCQAEPEGDSVELEA